MRTGGTLSKGRGRARGGPPTGRGAPADKSPPDTPTGITKTTMRKLAAGATALVVLTLSALFTGIGEGIATRVISIFSPADTTPSASPTLAREALTVAVQTDIGSGADKLALRATEDEGDVAAAIKADKLGEPWEAFLEHHDGAPIGDIVVSLLLTGHRNPGITVSRIGVEKVKTEQVLAGTTIRLISQGEAASILLAANLDEPQPTIMSGAKPYFPNTTITLANGEQQSVAMTLTGSAALYRWAFWIDYADETGAAHRVYINRQGRFFAAAADIAVGELFTLTGAAPSYKAVWEKNFPYDGFHLVK